MAPAADLDHDDGDARAAELLPSVEMPLSDDEAADGPDPALERLPPMLVSVLAYRPRFDPEREEWFVDVLLEASEAAETFVRFGLVRYQPNTRPGLRCSRLVRQFVQPLPLRIVDVTRLSPAEGGGLRVRLCGPTFYRRRVSRALHAMLRVDDTAKTPQSPVRRSRISDAASSRPTTWCNGPKPRRG